MSGNGNSNVMLNCLNNSINSNSTAQEYNSSVIGEGQNFISALSNYFGTETDVDKRRKFTVAQFSLMSSPAHKMCYLALISGNGFTCYFYKIIASSHYVCFIILFYNIFFYIYFLSAQTTMLLFPIKLFKKIILIAAKLTNVTTQS